MAKTILITLISLLLVFSAVAQLPITDQLPATSQLPLNELIEEARNIDPAQLPEIPKQIPFLGSDEDVNFHIRMKDGSETILGVRLRDRKVTEITDQIDDWTLKVEVREETIEQIAASEKPLKEAREAVKSKEIKIQGRTFAKKVKAAFLKLGLRLAGLFS